MVKIRPFLKWAGNKYRCIETILQSIPSANRLIEPFTGSAAVFLNANFPHYLLGEENKDLVSLFKHLQTEGESFIVDCKQLFCLANNQSEPYYLLRSEFNQCTEDRRRAILFLYLNRHGYNGLCRYNQQGIYNVPFGRYRSPYFPHKEMLAFLQKSKFAVFTHADFRQTFAKAIPGDVIYCDPPYAPLSYQTNFSSYTHSKFGEQEQVALAELAKHSADRGIPVVISNHDTSFTRDQYSGSLIQSFSVRRSIGCQVTTRVEVKELVAVFR